MSLLPASVSRPSFSHRSPQGLASAAQTLTGDDDDNYDNDIIVINANVFTVREL